MFQSALDSEENEDTELTVVGKIHKPEKCTAFQRSPVSKPVCPIQEVQRRRVRPRKNNQLSPKYSSNFSPQKETSGFEDSLVSTESSSEDDMFKTNDDSSRVSIYLIIQILTRKNLAISCTLSLYIDITYEY